MNYLVLYTVIRKVRVKEMREINELLSTIYRLREGEAMMEQYCVAVLDTTADGWIKNPVGECAGDVAGVLRGLSLAPGCEGNFQIAGIAKVKIVGVVTIGDSLVVADRRGYVRAKRDGEIVEKKGIVGRAISSASMEGSTVKCILMIPGEFQG